MVDDDRAAGGQADLTLEGGFDLGFDLITGEEGDMILIQLELVQVLRHHLFHELACLLVNLGIVDQDLIDIAAQVVANGTDGDTAFLIDQEGRLAFAGGLFDSTPDLAQIIQIPLQFLGTLAHTGGAHDHTHVVGDLELAHGIAGFAAIFALDTARNATGTGVVRHQHQITAGQTDEGGQRRTLVAALFLVDLDDQFLTFTQYLLDIDATRGLGRGVEILAGDLL